MILAVIQARMSSSRLPGKVLLPLCGKAMLERQIERVGKSRLIDRLIIATSDKPTDDPLAVLCRDLGLLCYRGSPEDVLDRYYWAARPHQADQIVRLTGDCPLTDPQLIDKVITFFLEGDYDYASNVIQPTFPDGLDVEVFTFTALEQSWREADLPSHREHVTPFIHSQPHRFRLGSYTSSPDLSGLRWTVDEPDDFTLASRIYEQLYPGNPDFTTDDILNLLDRQPELVEINAALTRNEGMTSSLRADRRHMTQRRALV